MKNMSLQMRTQLWKPLNKYSMLTLTPKILRTTSAWAYALVSYIVSKKDSCFICNHTIEEPLEKGDCYNCANCHNTLLKTTKNTKLMCTLTMQMEDHKLITFTCFNDAVKSFLTTINKGDHDVAQISPEVLNGLFLNSGKIKFICDTATKVVDKFFL